VGGGGGGGGGGAGGRGAGGRGRGRGSRKRDEHALEEWQLPDPDGPGFRAHDKPAKRARWEDRVCPAAPPRLQIR